MRRPLPFRHLLLGVLLALAGLAGMVQRADAQVPANDPKRQKQEGLNLLLRLGDYYAQAKVWREKMLEDAKTAMRQTERLTNLRQQVEKRVTGEGGIIGKHLDEPGWDDLWMDDPTQYCAVDEDGNSRCQAFVSALKRFDTIYDSVYTPYLGRLTWTDPRKEVVGFLGANYDTWQSDRRHAAIRGRLDVPLELAVTKANAAMQLDTIVMKSQAALDTIKKEQIDSTSLSSGRAQQLAAIGAVMEAEVRLQLARSRLSMLQATTAAAASAVLDQTKGRHTWNDLIR